MRTPRFVALVLVLGLAAIARGSDALAGDATPSSRSVRLDQRDEGVASPGNVGTFVPASDPRIVLEGRFDLTHSARPVVIWQASRIRVAFSGDTLGLRFGAVKGQVFFDADVDGKKTVVGLKESEPEKPIMLSGLGAGRHELMLFKRTEATAGTAEFRGLDLAPGAQIWPGTVPAYRCRMGFIGDSITVGACNEDGPKDQWENRRTHNAALSWAALTAAGFNADHRNIAVSGMGVSIGWFNQLAADIWDRMYPSMTAPRANLAKWTPDVVCVNFGENDNSYTHAHNLPFPANFTERYVALIGDIRRAFPKAEIVLLRGGMTGGATSEPLRVAWEAAVERLEHGDAHVHHYAFKHWSKTHPRVADDRAMADELIAWLRAQDFMPNGAKD